MLRANAMTVIRDHAIILTAIEEDYQPGNHAIYAGFYADEEIPWDVWESDFPAICMSYEQDADGLRGSLALDEDGTVFFIAEGRDEFIPDAGVWSERSAGYGYVQCIRQIGQHLYVCGAGGQVYQRRAQAEWVHLDNGLLRPDLNASPDIFLASIHGPHEHALYVAGCLMENNFPPFLAYFNGQRWRQLPLPANAERLTDIYVESAERIWLCGANGTLLLGNVDQGFVNVSRDTDNQLFYNIARHQGRLYLSSNLGLFTYDPARPSQGIAPVHTGLEPELEEVVSVGCDQQVLWVLAARDLLRFDGQHWERMECPYLQATLTSSAEQTNPLAYCAKDDSTLADALIRRTGYFAVDDFLRKLASQMGKPDDAFLPATPAIQAYIDLPELGLRLEMNPPHAEETEHADPARWMFNYVTFYLHHPTHGHFANPLPAGLDPENETPASAETKLGVKGNFMTKKTIRQGNYRDTYYLPNLLAMNITWKMQPDKTLRGIERVVIGAMGPDRPFPDPTRYPSNIL